MAPQFRESNPEPARRKNAKSKLKLILGSNYQGWNVSENIIAVKNLSSEPWEFGYAVGASRPSRLAASAHNCTFCPERNSKPESKCTADLGDRYSPSG